MDYEEKTSVSESDESLLSVPAETSDKSAGASSNGQQASRLWWLPRLFFRPKEFFEKHARSTSRLTVVLCAFVFGLAWSLTYYIDARKSPQLTYGPDVTRLYGNAVGLGAMAGAFWYYVWGAWYGLRLSFCKPQGVTRKLYRRTFIFSSLVHSLPGVIGLSIWWAIQDKYFLLGAQIVSAICIFWSVYVSYRGVRTVFQAARLRAVVLFLVLPCIFLGVLPIGLGISGRSADRKISVPFEHQLFTMHRPANWMRLEDPVPGAVQFHIPDVGGFMVSVRDDEGYEIDLEQTARGAIQRISEDFKTVDKKLYRFSEWGVYSGCGLGIAMDMDGNETIVRIFCCQLPDGQWLMAQEIVLAKEVEKLEARFEVVRKTFKVKPRH